MLSEACGQGALVPFAASILMKAFAFSLRNASAVRLRLHAKFAPAPKPCEALHSVRIPDPSPMLESAYLGTGRLVDGYLPA